MNLRTISDRLLKGQLKSQQEKNLEDENYYKSLVKEAERRKIAIPKIVKK